MVEYSPKNSLALSALLDIATGALALYVGLDYGAGAVQPLILFGLVAGYLRGRSGAGNPWIKGLLVGGYALVVCVFFAFWPTQGWHDWYQMLGARTYGEYLHHELRNKLAITALPLLFVLSTIAGAGLCSLQSSSSAKLVQCALLDIIIGAVFLMGSFVVDDQIRGPWLINVIFSIAGLIVAGLAAGFLRGRSGSANPLVKGLLVGGFALFLFVIFIFAWDEIGHLHGFVDAYWFILWPLLFVASSILGAWLRRKLTVVA